MIKRFHFTHVSSTNDYAKELLDDNEKVVVTADYQSSGKGRKGRNWQGEAGMNIYFSYGVKHTKVPSHDLCSLFQGLGCNIALKCLINSSNLNIFTLKYPNDILAYYCGNHRKIAGVLVEHSFLGNICDKSIIGIGINLEQTSFPDEIRDKAISLKMLDVNVDKDAIIDCLINDFEQTVINEDLIYNDWKTNLNIIGRELNLIDNGGTYIVKEMLKDGRLKAVHKFSGEETIIHDGESFIY